ncbi:glycosyltransferase family 2 protein [Vibrio caribbeanicus]|uniref:glycosyltransferase family 2 protein n=1 Tax=Vibrio caribbeanicus TaxID=701175 RepID=UPI002283A201|nr:glycosyltransferase family 2 protein [Vibrio caribbeanicus]MCY9844241.1 glycosyltransferase family 2 protein [Vibrio caribbeanicus]
MNEEFLLSVVIATHNREEYAFDSIRSIIDFTRKDVEVVISDTSDSIELKKKIERHYFNCERVRYSYISEELSMTENYNRAVSMARGRYVCLIGDDDSVHPSIAEFAELMDKQAINILTPRIIANYSWPDFETKVFGSTHSGKLYVDNYTREICEKNSREQLKKSLNHACQGTDHLPKFYHGLVKKSVLDQIKNKHGDYFFGVSPDVSISISLCLESKTYHTIDFPVTIPGASKNSNTGRSAMNKHKGNLEDDEHIKPFKNLHWDCRVPRFFSVETVWSQAAIETLKLYSLDSKFNYSRLYALCLIKHRGYFHQISQSRKDSKTSLLSVLLGTVSAYGKIFERILRRLLNPSASGGKKTYGPFNTIYDAIECIKNEQ